MNKIQIRMVKPEDIDRCVEIEQISYQGDEAANKEKILKRILTYPQGFILIEENNTVIGFINSGATDKVDLSDEAFKELTGHDSNGKHIVIMSVVVHPDFQKKGYANLLMHSFIEQMKSIKKQSIHLICQTHLIAMYQKQGFSYEAQSLSNHGGMKWHDMSMQLI